MNGEVTTFENGTLVKSDDKIKIDEILIDGKASGDVGELVLKDRELLGDNGIVIVSVTIDKTTKKRPLCPRGFRPGCRLSGHFMFNDY